MTYNVERRDTSVRNALGIVLAPPSAGLTAPAWIHVAPGVSPAVSPERNVYRKAAWRMVAEMRS